MDILREIEKDLKMIKIPPGLTYKSPHIPEVPGAQPYNDLNSEEKKIVILMDKVTEEQRTLQTKAVYALTSEESRKFRSAVIKLRNKKNLLDAILWFKIISRLDIWLTDEPIVLLPDLSLGVNYETETSRTFGEASVISLSDQFDKRLGSLISRFGANPCSYCRDYHN